MKKKVLLTPGPSSVPPEVLEATSRPIIHHRTNEFQEIFTGVNENLKYVFRTKSDVMTFASSGTGAMEGCVANLMNQGDSAVVVQGGKFGERWAEICEAFGVSVILIDVEWGNAVSDSQIETVFKNNPDIKAVFVTHCETSTGTATDIQSIAKVVNKTKAILVVDAISSLGAMELQKDNWGIDAVVSGSQKGLMIPPGLAFCSLSDKAWKMTETSKLPKYYFNFAKARKSVQKNDTPWTPAVSLVIGLNEALKMIRSEGIENTIERHKTLAIATRKGMQAMGLKLYSKFPADAVTAVVSPDGVDSGKLVKLLRTKYGISIAGGQGDAKGKIFRVAHMGYMNKFDVFLGITAVGSGLNELGYKVDIGKGINAAEEVFAGNKVIAEV